MLFYQIGELFQSYAVGKSRRNISELMDIRPDYANIEEDGKLEKVDPDEVAVGSTIIVQPGEKVPLDGIVLEGSSSLNTSALTGESLPREVNTGRRDHQRLHQYERFAQDSDHQASLASPRYPKSWIWWKTQAPANPALRTSSPNLPVCIHRLSASARWRWQLLPPLFRMLVMGAAPMWSQWVYRALTFLVISCPCALVISIPLSFFAGIGGASKAGCAGQRLQLSGNPFTDQDALCLIRQVRLTQGVFEVNGIHHSNIHEDQLVEYAALAESASSHPISKSLQRAYGKQLDRSRVTNVQEISGNGVIATVDGMEIAAGNDKLMDRLGRPATSDCHQVGTIIHMAIDGKYAGHIVISDIVKPHAKEAIEIADTVQA